ncbi:hypothetical protein NOS3756_13830 [Nostoc sp. NIES-3756]|uniref:mannosyltransferase family protein n=1 Tax=Nostoc sp. NIES-3756 TaxID=1751286 RepID=UPI0007200024|nr:mannosyltransferase family protein [Nostoc sp. NIES-3756]BAT52443.1 hypothetical protein NOS3756_13830 [Nostoc sp. NIES-3756]
MNSLLTKIKTINLGNNSLLFPILIWFSSRAIIVISMLVANPAITTPIHSIDTIINWDIFYAWDSDFYKRIATSGYEFSLDKKQYSVAFFPLFPLLSRIFMRIGLPFEISAFIVNNLSFLAALIILYLWIEERQGVKVARWSTAILAWCPYSIFGTVIYTEGLFLLCSTAALKGFDKKQYWLAAFWGALSTATRLTGIALIPTFLFVSWKEHRSLKAYVASLAVSLGILFYSFYCQIAFGEPLAFMLAQKGWRDSAGFAWAGWLTMIMQITVGKANYKSGTIVDPWHPLLFLLIIGIAYLLLRLRPYLSAVKLGSGLYILWLFLWLLAGDEVIKFVLIFGGLYLLWIYRQKIPLVACVYGFFSYGLILNTGITASTERYAYAIVSLSMAFGLLLNRFPRFGYACMFFFTIVLASFAIRFSQNQWVA